MALAFFGNLPFLNEKVVSLWGKIKKKSYFCGVKI